MNRRAVTAGWLIMNSAVAVACSAYPDKPLTAAAEQGTTHEHSAAMASTENPGPHVDVPETAARAQPTPAVRPATAVSGHGAGGTLAKSGVEAAGAVAKPSMLPTAGAGMSGSTAMLPDAGAVDHRADAGSATGTCLKSDGDFTNMGPYAIRTREVTVEGKGQYTIYYPDPLEQACAHPIVAWGNGSFIEGGTAYAHFDNHMASWGIVVIVSHDGAVGDGSFHRAGIDYLLAQNEDSTSEFFGKLEKKAGVTGHSQGARGSDAAAAHPNVAAVVNLQGSFGEPPASKAAFMCLTGTEDLRPDDCPAAVSKSTTPSLLGKYQGLDHLTPGTTPTAPGTIQYARLLVGWFRCFLSDDSSACALFQGGENCRICGEPGWAEIFVKNY